MAKTNDAQVISNTVSMIGSGTEIVGKLVCTGDLRIDGLVDGSVRASGKVVIGEQGQMYGEVECRNADVSGFMKGSLVVGELLAMKSSARMTGEIRTQKLSIEPGCVFTGTCDMGGVDDPRGGEVANVSGGKGGSRKE